MAFQATRRRARSDGGHPKKSGEPLQSMAHSGRLEEILLAILELRLTFSSAMSLKDTNRRRPQRNELTSVWCRWLGSAFGFHSGGN